MNTKFIKVSLSSLTATVLMSGCASMFSGNSDEININSVNPNTLVYVNDKLIGRGNVTTTVARGEKHEIRAAAEGCESTVQTTGLGFDATSLLGCLIDFCIISVPMDLAIGGAQKVSPRSYSVQPICGATAENQLPY